MLGGLIASVFLYPKKEKWGKKLRWLLFFLRFFTVTLLLILFLKPYLRVEEKIYENPVLVVGIDNSRSIGLVEDSAQLIRLKQGLDSLIDNLTAYGYEVQIRNMGGYKEQKKVSDIPFDFHNTDFSDFFNKTEEEFENRNQTCFLLLTDGIYNKGTSPELSPSKKPVYVIAIGDTTQKKDIVLKNLVYNKNVFGGNKFPVIAEISSFNLQGSTGRVEVRNRNRLLASKEITISSSKEFFRVEFILNGDTTGKEIVTVQILPVEGEFTTTNNSRNAYIDFQRKKEKILIIAAVPHPDLKTLLYCLQENETYNVDLKTITTSNDIGLEKENPQLVIFHQIPNSKQLGNELPARFISKDIPVFYIMGAISQTKELEILKPGCIINSPKGTDQVTAVVNPQFEKFNISTEQKNFIAKAPPLEVLYGEYVITPGSEIVLFQQVGAVVTQNPLLLLNEKGNVKNALLTGEGIWKWRLFENSQTVPENHTCELIKSVTQYLMTKHDLKKFRVYPLEDEYTENDKIIFNAETYNDNHEKIYNREIQLELLKEPDTLQAKKAVPLKFSFTNNQTYEGLTIGNLESGLYTYKATTLLDNKEEQERGIFTVKKVQLEEMNLRADHSLLSRMARESGGRVFYKGQLKELKDSLLALPKARKLLQTREENKEWLHSKWLFLFVLMLIVTEWGLRKYFGQY
ncbi:MAG: hypothetical protein A3G23_04025 [Bacteroidetes bacterium RIFCSPLOWO2_12_FULL_37_12]|nr:MAG: hypothetical protein A3G23_04025 [Bacteroidetes bacterium RIFCSPLOWO2_12_FULL_37_12]